MKTLPTKAFLIQGFSNTPVHGNQTKFDSIEFDKQVADARAADLNTRSRSYTYEAVSVPLGETALQALTALFNTREEAARLTRPELISLPRNFPPLRYMPQDIYLGNILGRFDGTGRHVILCRMVSTANAIKEYLISLGYKVEAPAFRESVDVRNAAVVKMSRSEIDVLVLRVPMLDSIRFEAFGGNGVTMHSTYRLSMRDHMQFIHRFIKTTVTDKTFKPANRP